MGTCVNTDHFPTDQQLESSGEQVFQTLNLYTQKKIGFQLQCLEFLIRSLILAELACLHAF